MNLARRAIAMAELLLTFPAALFMAALIMRNPRRPEFEPARTAQLIVTWYAERQWTLWILLLALPLIVLVTGCAFLLRGRLVRADPATLFIAAMTVTAFGVLVVVVLHMLAN